MGHDDWSNKSSACDFDRSYPPGQNPSFGPRGTRIGTCGSCGGDVIGHTGPWWGVNPPPAPKCNRCGKSPKGSNDRIEME